MNLVDSVIDEIALEGLDGITLEALWDRMAVRWQQKVPISQTVMDQIWNVCLHVQELSFYELEKERDKLIIFDRYKFTDPELGTLLEKDNLPNDIYEHCAIDDWMYGIKGSCATYYTRKEIGAGVKNLTVQQAQEIYGRKLVIVASQEMRQNALIDKSACPTVDLNVALYCFLERVGRSRYHGEMTQGKLSLSALKEYPSKLFYQRKVLTRHKLVTKQTQYQKSCCPSLLHLPRFYVERKPTIVLLIEKVINFLKSRPNHMASLNEIKKELNIENSLKRQSKTALFQQAFFQKVVNTDQVVPWRTLYPNAPPSEWQCKNNRSKEKTLRVLQLIDPNVDVSDLWKDDCTNEDEEPNELDISQQLYCVPFVTQANSIVEACKEEGLNRLDLARKMGLPQLHARTICRNLVRINIVSEYMLDVGRQRVTKYVSRKFVSGSQINKQLKLEMLKMKELTEPSTEKTRPINDQAKGVDLSKSSKNEEENQSIAMEKDTNDIKSEPLELPKTDNSQLFKAATMVIRKYKLAGCKRSYKKTFCNVADMSDIAIQSKLRKLMTVKGEDNNAAIDAKLHPIETPEMRELKTKFLMSEQQTSDVVSLKDFASTDFPNQSNISYRLLKRANIIIEAVKKHKIIDDMAKLIKMMTEEEEKEGYYVKIDKKSVIRLLQRLAKDKLVKNIKLTLSTGNKKTSMTFICHPSIDVNNAAIRSAVEQAKLKCCLNESQPKKTPLHTNEAKSDVPNESEAKIEAVDQSKVHVKPVKKGPADDFVYDSKAGPRYGYAPKFTRMQALHRYLFYLAYEHPGKPRESQTQLIDVLRSKGAQIDEQLENSMSDIYNTEIGWKMFVPPLAKHDGWPRGWALMCDILYCMPLSIFVKLHKVSYIIPELEERLKDPIKKHLLVKETPLSIRNVLLMRRKYVCDIYRLTARLCYMGLLQFGPQKLQEKDKVFVYLNRRTELMDTTSSAAGYHKIEAKIYPVIGYKFTTLNNVDEYWFKLWKICANTRLGGRLVVQGKDIILEDLRKKAEMVEAMQPRTVEEAYRMDDGHVPGDRMGAAGIDSAFFAHLKRSWNADFVNYPYRQQTGDQAAAPSTKTSDAGVARIKSRPLRFVDLNEIKKKAKPPVINDPDDSEKTQSKTSTADNGASLKSKNPRLLVKGGRTSNRPKSYVRRVLPRMNRARARVKYDEIDHSALQRMNKLRVDWDTREDNILLVCKVAMMYLCPQPRKQMIGFAAVRDVLRSYSLTSYNKTSRACQRRLLYILKTPETHLSVNLGVEELRQNFYINRRFGETMENLKRDYRGTEKYNEQLNLVFRDLVSHIAKKYYDITDMQAPTLNLLPTTCEEFHLFHRVKYPKRVTGLQAFNDATTNDIHSAAINSVIHSSMCCVKDRRSWAYQLFRIYQQYPEWLLRSAMTKIRADQMVTIKKNYAFAIRKQPNTCMPMSSSQYQLSSAYVQKFNTKFPFGAFKEAWDFFVQLVTNYTENHSTNESNARSEENSTMISTPVNGGTIAAINDFVNIAGLCFDVEIPRHTIMLDPMLQKDDERYVRIARRYQDILSNFEHVNIEDILNRKYKQEVRNNTQEDGTDHAVPSTSSQNLEDSNLVIDESALENDSSDKPQDANPENDPKPKKRRRKKVKQHDTQKPTTDTEAVESEQETNFDDENCCDEIDENDCEDDDLICFTDGTTIRLTREDIENSGYVVNPQNDSVMSRGNKRAREHSSSTKLQENQFPDVPNRPTKKLKLDITEPPRNENPEMGPKLFRNTGNCQTEECQSGVVRVNELIERTNFNQLEHPSHYRIGETYDVQKRYTRLAMLRMREELHDLASTDSHHAHDYFVLNMFKVFHSLRPEKIERPLDLTTFQGLQLPKQFLLCNPDRYSAIINDLKKFAIFPKNIASYEKFKKNLCATDEFKRGLDAVYEFIRDKREIGASLSQLSTTFYRILGKQLFDILSVLKEERMVLRSGITNTRYIHQKYSDPWLIHSYKIMRLQKEAQQVAQPGSLYVVSQGSTKDENSHKRKIVTKRMKKPKVKPDNLESDKNMDIAEKNEDGESPESDKRVPEDSAASKMNQGKMQKSRTCLLPTKDIYRAARQLDLDTAEEIRVVVRPWIRIDGALNRRVLDRMLGAVLAYCLVHPGVHVTKVEEKFTPAIQPFHTKELIEILVRLECLKMGCARKPRVTLFSKSPTPKPVFSYMPEHCRWLEEELVVEPMLDATLKFSTFLSTRTYTSDFLA